MKAHLSVQFMTISARLKKNIKTKTLFVVMLGVSAVALATPPSGVVLNQILAQGADLTDIRENLKVASSADPVGDDDWHVKVQTQGATDFYVQHLIVAPGGYGGWHTHPGFLVGTVVSGSIDFYNANCEKRSFTAGQVFTENNEVHSIINTGTVNAELSVAYLIKHGEPRRIEADAPVCAPSTGIP